MLGIVGSNFKIVKFFMQHFRMLHDVVVVWPGRCNMLHLGMRTCSIFITQHVATRRNRVAKRPRHVAPNNVAICCVQAVRSFRLGLQMLGQQCWDILC